MRLDLVRDAAAAARLPELLAERCVHSLIEQATCRRCVDACPTGAWVIDDDRLGIDPARCDGCGLCAPACPQAAIVARTAEPLLVASPGGSAPGGSAALALIACDRAAAPVGRPSGRQDAIARCIHALGPRDLARLATAGCRRLVVATGDCDACPRGGAVRLERRLADLARLLDSRGLPLLRIERLPYDRWLALRDTAAPDAGPAMARRAFLRRGVGLAVDHTASTLGLAEAERTAVETVARLLPDTGAAPALAAIGPRIDPVACTGCDACVRLCPQQAIRLQRTERRRPGNADSHSGDARSGADGQTTGSDAAVGSRSGAGVQRRGVAAGEGSDAAPVDVTPGDGPRTAPADAPVYRIAPADCTGCGICVDVCADRAIRLEAWPLAAPATLALAEATCARCRVRFHRPVIETRDGPARCPICARRSGTDRLYRIQE